MPSSTVLYAILLLCCLSYGNGATSPMSNCTEGRITYYTYNNNGNCGFGAVGSATLKYPYIVAPNDAFYANGTQCGGCYELTGPSGTVIVMVADRCPASGNPVCVGDMDHFDMGPNATTAFAQIADVSLGNTLISKRQVACPLTGNVGVRTKDAVSTAWMALLVYNHRVQIAALQIQHGGVWYNMSRQIYNYWTFSPPSALAQPFNIRIYPVVGSYISMSIPTVAAEKLYDSGSQFAVPPAGYGGSSSTLCKLTASPIIYDDALFKGKSYSVSWIDVSFGFTSRDWAYAVAPKVGSKCLQVKLNAYGAVQLLRKVPFNITDFQALSFWAKVEGVTSFNKFKVIAQGGASKSVTLTQTWAQFVLPLNASGLNAPNPFGGDSKKFQFQNNQNAVAPTIYMDQIVLVPA